MSLDNKLLLTIWTPYCEKRKSKDTKTFRKNCNKLCRHVSENYMYIMDYHMYIMDYHVDSIKILLHNILGVSIHGYKINAIKLYKDVFIPSNIYLYYFFFLNEHTYTIHSQKLQIMERFEERIKILSQSPFNFLIDVLKFNILFLI